MAMIPQLFTINGVATEVGLDRRMVGSILANVPCDGTLKGKPAWRLATFLQAKERREEYSGRSRGDRVDDSDLIALEHAARRVDELLDQLRGIPDIETRRRLLQSGRGHCVGEFMDAFERSRGFLNDSARTVSEPFANMTAGRSFRSPGSVPVADRRQ